MSENFSAWHYDGESAIRRGVTIAIVGDGFLLDETERRTGPFDFAQLKRLPDQGGDPVFGLIDRAGWRLGLTGPVPAELEARLPRAQRYGGIIDRLGLGKASIAFAVVSAGVIAGVLAAPQVVAPIIPPGWERQMGDAMVGDFGGRLCHTPDGDAALATLVERIEPGAEDIRVDVAKIDMVNAITVPGGRIIIFQGLLDEARSADEVAGVIGHEIGHVRHRDVLAAMLRQFGLSVILGGLDSNVGGTLNGLLSMSYGRDAERAADNYSIEAMQVASVSPRDTADFFQRLAKQAGEAVEESKAAAKGKDAGKAQKSASRASDLMSYISSHPLSSERRRAFIASEKRGAAYRPAISAAQWQALRGMCRKDKNAKSGFGL